MTSTNATNFRKNIFELLEQAVKYNEPVHVTTKDGNAVVMSEEEYNSMMETLYLSSIPKVREDVIEGLHAPDDEFVPEDEVDW